MQYGLSGGQVAKMLMYFMPATQPGRCPIAALFATTVVYGRLAPTNELTACRAHGISYLTMALPAFWLGIILACVQFACLSFIVAAIHPRAGESRGSEPRRCRAEKYSALASAQGSRDSSLCRRR